MTPRSAYDVTFLSDAIGVGDVAAYETSVNVNYPTIGGPHSEFEPWTVPASARTVVTE